MLLLDFINANSNWKDLLSSDPYNLSIKEDNNLIIFCYNQIDSDFDIPLVSECRGIILEKDTYKVVAYPFNKFWNIQESRACKIDWNSAKVLEKIDGSIIKLYYYNGWNISTMSVIDGKKSQLQSDIKYNTFAELFDQAAINCNLDYDKLDKNHTYIFELVSPYNKVVVYYPDIKIYHIGTRDNISLQELNVDIGIDKPKSYSFKSLDDILENCKSLPFDEEGYVVVDKYFNRVKIKSVAYVEAHHLVNNGVVTSKRVLALILKGQMGEFLSYFPEYKDDFDIIEKKYNKFCQTVLGDIAIVKCMKFDTKKDYALFVKKMKYPSVMFAWYNKPDLNVMEYINNIRIENLTELIEKEKV